MGALFQEGISCRHEVSLGLSAYGTFLFWGIEEKAEMIFIRKIFRRTHDHRVAVLGIIVACIAFGFFLWLQSDPTFADPDSFYHTKMALLIQEQGIITTFPWMQFTVISEHFTDQHFLYHVALIPFVHFFDPLIGMKIATVLLATAVIVGSYLLLVALKVRYAAVYALLLLVVAPFSFRMSLAKAPSVSLLFLILGLLLLVKKKKIGLFILSFIYVWSYGGFLLLLVMTGAWTVIGWIMDRRHHIPHLMRQGFRRHMRNVIHNQHVQIFFSVFTGTMLGVVINPYFPSNLQFYWHQLVQIGIINYRDVIGVGNEWYPYVFIELVSNTIFLSIIIVMAAVLFGIFLRHQRREGFVLAIMMVFFFVLTLKSKRYIEYYVPFGMLFGAVAINAALQRMDFRHFLRDVGRWYMRHLVIGSILAVYFLVTLPTIAVRDMQVIKGDLSRGSSLTHFSQSSDWLKHSTPAGSVVFHSSWDEFPSLFYNNSHNYYIIGLDPTFMYAYDKDMYQTMVNITTGVFVPDVGRVLRDSFHASYVFVEKKHTAMRNLIVSDNRAELVHEDSEAWIYQLLPL
ncbi:MAG: hypothetical protein WC289_01405 [Patescibacteria group bacterium]